MFLNDIKVIYKNNSDFWQTEHTLQDYFPLAPLTI